MGKTKHVTNAEAISDYGFTQQEIESLVAKADAYDRGEWPAGEQFHPVPRDSDEISQSRRK